MTIGGNARPAQPVTAAVLPRGPAGGGGGWAWELGPAMTEANGVHNDFAPFAGRCIARADQNGRIYVMGTAQFSHFRLDSPYLRWFQMGETPADKVWPNGGGEAQVDPSNGLIVMGGSFEDAGGARYHPDTDPGWPSTVPDPWDTSWAFLADATENLQAVASVQTPARTWILGGGFVDDSDNYAASLDTDSGSWVRVADFPGSPRQFHSACNYGEVVYIAGGDTTDNTALDAFYRWDGAWSTLAPLPVETEKGAMCADGTGRVYYFGGSASGIPVSTVYRYDPATGAWTQLADIPGDNFNPFEPNSQETTPAIRVGNRIYLLVNSAFEQVTRVAAYSTSRDSWQLSPPSSTGHFSGGFAKGGNHLFALAGSDYFSTATSVVEKIRVL